ncbi:MAG: hypothetical protein AVO39_10170 [delta proteobacterium MLS_D]|nr:MAG: hypothetical protein AVO39_10170 [delta proteobacterium MLS_D]
MELKAHIDPFISITKKGVMIWNKNVLETYEPGTKQSFRIFYDKREELLGFSLCRKDAEGAVEMNCSEKTKQNSFGIIKLFKKIGLDWQQYIGKYRVHSYESDHVITFYIDLKQRMAAGTRL